MATRSEEILKLALELGPIDRAELVERLLTSFDLPERRRIDALWEVEAEDRIDAYERGELKATPAGEVFDHIARR